MELLVADSFSERQLSKLAKRGHHVRHEPTLGAGDLPGAIGDADVLVVRSTKVTAETIGAATRLGLIIRAGAGTNTIDVTAASDQAIYVCNVPGQNAVAVAELTMGLLLALDRRIPDNVRELRSGHWAKSEFSKAKGLFGQRLGIVGMGAIGYEVAMRAKAFGMKVYGLESRSRTEERQEMLEESGIRMVPDLETLLAECDVVSLHVPATPDTSGMVDAEFLSNMKDGSWLINTCRSEVVDERALLDALDAKAMWAALDVFPDEPGSGTAEYSSRLAEHPRVYGTHHIGASTEQAQEAIAKRVVSLIDIYAEGTIEGAVNLESLMDHTTVIGIRHLDQVGVLSAIFSVLRTADLNVEHMENHVFQGTRGAKAVLHVHGDFNDDIRSDLEEIPAVMSVAVLRETDYS